MKTRWESFVFILLMLLPAVCLLNTGTRPVASLTANTQPCSSENRSQNSSETKTGRTERNHEGVPRHSGNTAGVSPASSIQGTTGKISK
jgi:hypothetical protein